MALKKSHIPIFTRDGYELFSLNCIYEMTPSPNDAPPNEWLSANEALVKRVQQARYAQIKGGPTAQITLEGQRDLTFGMRDIAILYAHSLSDECGAAVSGALLDPLDVLSPPSREQPRTHVEVERAAAEDTEALSRVNAALYELEQQLERTLAATSGGATGEFPLLFHMELATGMSDADIWGALEQVSPPPLYARCRKQPLNLVLSSKYRFIDLKSRVECAIEVLDTAYATMTAGAPLDPHALTAAPSASGRRCAAAHVDAYLRAHGELVVACVDSREYQHQAVLRDSQLLSRIVKL